MFVLEVSVNCEMHNIISVYLLVFQCLNQKGKWRIKQKLLKRKRREREENKGKTQGEDLKEPLADNDDSSSTTTETSNPDMEANNKEVHTRETC